MEQVVPHGWVGVDVGKGHHWVCLIDEAGATLWSANVVNDESAILEPIAAVLGRAGQVVWAVDIIGTAAGLLLALLGAHGHRHSRCHADVGMTPAGLRGRTWP